MKTIRRWQLDGKGGVECVEVMLPCPFCGHGADGDILPHDMRDDDNLRESPGWQMRCEWDGARGPEESTREKAQESWNRRVSR